MLWFNIYDNVEFSCIVDSTAVATAAAATAYSR